MKGIARGSRVTFTDWIEDSGTGHARHHSGVQAGTVLDRGPDTGTWWVSVVGERGAVLVHARFMTDSNAIGARA